MYKKILYIGASLHLDPIKHFNECNEFIFVDSQPRNEYGYDYYYKGFYKSNFVELLLKEFKKYDFIKIDEKVLTNNYEEINIKHLESTCLTFVNGERKVKYYISTGLPIDINNNKVLQNDIIESDTLLVSGHYPDSIILDYIKRPFNIILYSQTWYPETITDLDKYDNNTIIYNILKTPEIIKSYLYVNYETGDKSVLYCNYEDILIKKSRRFNSYYMYFFLFIKAFVNFFYKRFITT